VEFLEKLEDAEFERRQNSNKGEWVGAEKSQVGIFEDAQVDVTTQQRSVGRA
jgi:hypothetical protein